MLVNWGFPTKSAVLSLKITMISTKTFTKAYTSNVISDLLVKGQACPTSSGHIVPHAQGRLGRPQPHRAQASRASSNRRSSSSRARTSPSHSQAGATESSEARGSVLLNCSLLYLFKETSTIASTLERTSLAHKTIHKLDYDTGEPLAKWEARYLFSVMPV